MTGNSIMVFRDGTLIAGTKSDSLKTQCDLIATASPSDGQWENSIAGRRSWSITVDWLLSAVDALGEVLHVGTVYTLRIGSRSGGGLTGKAILKSCQIQSSIGAISRGSFSFTGTGPLSAVSG